MKHTFWSFLLLFGATLVATAQPKPVNTLFLAGPYPLNEPAFGNIANVKGDQFSSSDLFKVGLPCANLSLVNGSVCNDAGKPDNAWKPTESNKGEFIFIGNGKTAVGYALFFADAGSFTKGTLSVKSPLQFEVYVDGSRITEKTSTEKAGEEAKSSKLQLKLPPRQHQFLVKLLFPKDYTDTAKLTIKLDIPEKQREQLTINSAKRPITINDILEGVKVASTSISPSGKYASVTFSKVDTQTGKTSRFTRYYNLRNQQEVFTPQGSAACEWMPSGSRLWWVDATNDNALTTYNVETGELAVVAKNIPEKAAIRWAPNEQYVVCQVEDDVKIEEKGPMHQIVTPEDRQPGWRDRSFLYKIDLKSGIKQRMTFGYKSTYLSDISADSKSIIVTVAKEVYTERPFSVSSIYRIDAESFRADTILKDQKFLGAVKLSPDTKQLIVLGGPEAFNKIGQNVKKSPIANSYDNQAFLYTIESGKVEPISKSFDPSVDAAEWSADGKSIIMQVSEKDRNNLYRYDIASSKYIKIPTSCDVVSSFDFAREADGIVYAGQSGSYPSVAYYYSPSTSSTATLADPAKEKMGKIQLGEMHDWNFKAKDGTTIEGRFYLPPGFDPAKKYPLIVNYYGGTTPTERNFESRYPLHLYASMGYVVYVVQPSGAIGYGQEFSARHVNTWGKKTADDIIEGTTKFMAEHPYVDATKVGCIGASYGGFMTQYLQTRTNLFAAAISHAGISDITSYWGEGYWGYTYSAGATANSYPWNNPSLYIGQSPLFSANKVNTPILFLHGQEDTNVPIGESIQMYTALKVLGKTAEFVTVEGQNHTIVGYKARIAWNNTIFAWFAKYLQGNDGWWNELYPEKNL
ncbi:prolyl oligopeptidase family serine peptidase [uncultured Acetobacteroides sp.]|uniref:S9 family peptidase n=1 Tax=uncultured Acetobacteroides sp. TaxID=1760811 RepID=UPI0029F5A69D|nr:prolyl oligopeptidase family serine peptidase [uncultured Acetobacteroides sp.]